MSDDNVRHEGRPIMKKAIALLVAAMSFVGFLVGGVTGSGVIALIVGLVLLALTIFVISAKHKKAAN